jgi:thymidylate kinase
MDDPSTTPLAARAFYYLSNYLAAQQEISMCLAIIDLETGTAETVTVVDRFYYSSLCYSLGQSYATKTLKSEPDSIWDWPFDLILPTVIILLDLPEDERQRRLKLRNSEFTINEELLEKKQVRERIIEAYNRVTSIPVVKPNAALEPEELVEESLRLLTEYL